MGDEARQVQSLTEEVERLKWRISTLETAEFECVRLMEAVRASEERFRRLLEEAGFPITISTLKDSSILYANPLACTLFGLEGPVPKGRRMVEFYLQDVARADMIAWIRAEGVVRNWEVLLRNGTGQPRVVLVSSSLVTYEGQEAVLATSNDITERKHAEALFQTMVETSPDAFTITDLSGALTWASTQTLRLLGHETFEEIRGRNILEFVAPGDHEQVRDRLSRVMQGQHLGPLEVSGIMKDGSLIPHESNAEVLRNPDGSPSAFFFITRDLTRRKRAERALRLAEKLEGLGLMAAGIAHDLNNAFQVVQGHLELALDLRKGDSGLREALTPALDGVNRSAVLARNMLDYSGQANREMGAIDLRGVVQERLALWRDSIPPEVTVALHCDEPLPPLNGDEVQLAKLVTALVLNAVEAMQGKAGTVDILLEVVELIEEDLALGVWLLPTRTGACLRLEVRDQGCGIPEEDIDKVADPFFTTKGQGRGLGLSVALGVLRGHRAGLQIHSRVGSGTRMRAHFPMLEEPSRRHVAPATLPPMTAGILLAEDEEVLRDLIAGQLRAWGYAPVLEAKDGAEALALFKARGAEIGLLVTDATMPRMTGPELLDALRQLRPELPAILVTGYASGFLEDSATSYGFSAFLQKPFRFAELRAALDGLLPNPGT